MSDPSTIRREIGAVVSFHLNAHTCGVARFNTRLAEVLGVPLVGLREIESSSAPLLSVKISELDLKGLEILEAKMDSTFGLILHGFDGTKIEIDLVKNAQFVMVLNNEMFELVKPIRSDCLVGFAPGVFPTVSVKEADVKLITFGMAHKINAFGYGAIAGLISSDPRTFCLEISSALHEGTRFDDQFFAVKEEISEVFAGNVRFLGFLADGEVQKRLMTSNAMLAFFNRGVRENNTSVLGAMAHGLPVITNLDEFSPAWMIHDETIFDVLHLSKFPSEADLIRVGRAGREAVSDLTYEELARRLGCGAT